MLTSEEFHLVYMQGEEATYSLFYDLLTAHSERIDRLEARVNKNSANSSKPPSADVFKKPPTNLRKKTDKKPGGQPGHTGKTLQMREDCAPPIVHSPSDCSQCGACLADVAASQTDAAQVHDLPPLALVVTAHARERKVCPHCRHETAAAFPEGIVAGAQYGPGLKALAVYLQHGQYLPSARAAEFLEQVFGASVSEGSLLNFLRDASERLAPVEAAIKAKIAAAPMVHFDETGMRIDKHLAWVHVACTDRLTYHAAHAKRGKEALDAIGLLKDFAGTALHDCFASYFQRDICHGLCNCHLCRELKGLQEARPRPWIARLMGFLFGLKRRKERAQARGLLAFAKPEMQTYLRAYDRLVRLGQSENPAAPASGKRGKTKQSEAYNLLKRLDERRESVLRFATDFQVPFDNNQAERDLRMVKLRQKISGCFRGFEGAEIFCRIRGFLSTWRKHDRPLLPALTNLFTGSLGPLNLQGE